MRLVLNASPIICLAKAGLLNEVLSMAQEVAVPQTVADEILAVLDLGRWFQPDGPFVVPAQSLSLRVVA